MTSEGVHRYRVFISQVEQEKLRKWGKWASEIGLLDDLLGVLRTIEYRLSVEPDEWGEPRYQLKALGFEVRIGVTRLVNVWYGVDRDRHIVFVKTFQFRSDCPQGVPPDSN